MTGKATHSGPQPIKPLHRFGKLWMRALGWKLIGEMPAGVDRAVFIAAPHTTNWDLPHMLGVSWALRVRMAWLGKDSLFSAPGGFALKWLGGRPVDRSAPHGLVGEAARLLRETEGGLWLAVPPSGTRGFRDHWRSGFYHIAREANVPIICGFIDYSRKEMGIADHFVPTGDMTADMDRIRAAYAAIEGKFNDLKSTIRLKDELE
ncbi:MAG: 1-acyl-sn-glycerol-3-phosphate acyltransferase [Myxococcales bacterium]|nr:1-acyl-sn-glycerol-3-phosphate acyltransferase [Myxococcales bacterium]